MPLGRPVARVACATALALAAGTGFAQDEFAPFRLTDIDGRVRLRFVEDDLTTTLAGARSWQEQSDLRAELYVSTRSFVYHPNFLLLDVGFGPILQQARFHSDFADTSDRSALYDLTARATFLRDKPYNGALFYEHLNPHVSVGPAQVLLQENQRYGVEFALLDPATPLPLRFDASRQHTSGSGTGLTMDDRIDQAGLVADVPLGAAGSSQLRYRLQNVDSRSGSEALPIQRTRSDTRSAALDTRLQLGTLRQIRLVNLLTYDKQHFELGAGLPPERETARALLDLRVPLGESVRSFAAYNFDHDDQIVVRSNSNRVAAGLDFTPNDALTATLDGRGERTRTDAFALSVRSAGGSARYRHDIAGGTAETGYAVRFETRDQRAAEVLAQVTGERLVLNGVSFVALGRPRADVATIVLSNETRSQTYIEGLDYTVTVLGEETRLQRIASGNITDGQVVLVDYAYRVGGTFTTTETDQTLNVGWSWRRYFNVYARWFDGRPRLQSGTPLLTLNTIRSTVAGARADVPLGTLFTVGGGFEHETRRETILPFRRNAADLYAQMDDALLGPGGLRLGLRRVRVDYVTSSLDVDLTAYDVRYWVRLPGNVELQVDGSTERDRGTDRRRDFGAARLRWRYRQLSASLNLTQTRETQGVVQTRRTLGQVLVQRDF